MSSLDNQALAKVLDKGYTKDLVHYTNSVSKAAIDKIKQKAPGLENKKLLHHKTEPCHTLAIYTMSPKRNLHNNKFPATGLFFMNFVLAKAISGIWDNCSIKRYPRTRLKRMNMSSSWSTALSRNVIRVAVYFLTFIAEIEEL